MKTRIAVLIFLSAFSGAIVRYGLSKFGIDLGFSGAIATLAVTICFYLSVYFKRLTPPRRRWKAQRTYRDIGALGLLFILLIWSLIFLDLLPEPYVFWIFSGLGTGVYFLAFR